MRRDREREAKLKKLITEKNIAGNNAAYYCACATLQSPLNLAYFALSLVSLGSLPYLCHQEDMELMERRGIGYPTPEYASFYNKQIREHYFLYIIGLFCCPNETKRYIHMNYAFTPGVDDITEDNLLCCTPCTAAWFTNTSRVAYQQQIEKLDTVDVQKTMR